MDSIKDHQKCEDDEYNILWLKALTFSYTRWIDAIDLFKTSWWSVLYLETARSSSWIFPSVASEHYSIKQSLWGEKLAQSY